MTNSTTPEPLNIKSIHSQTLDLPPSCIQFCPSQPGIFCVGTYYLHPKQEPKGPPEDDNEDESQTPSEQTPASQQKRTGSLILFRLEDDNTITRLSTLPTDFAVLDIQWNPRGPQGEEILAVATSTGNVVFYAISQGAALLELEHVRTLTIDPGALVLSLLWHPTRKHVLGLTLSDGRVLVLHRTDPLWSAESEGDALQMEELHVHDLEAWICTFLPSSSSSSPSPEDETTLLSGGDDMSLRCAHLTTQNSSPSPVWQDRKLHQAGITYLLPMPHSPATNLVISGSYDDHIRLLSLPSVGRRRVLAELNLGGGVWRLKVLHTSSDGSVVLLASCMHAGSRIVKLVREAKADVQASENEGWRFEVLGKFEEHQSMNYGSDAVRSTNGRWRVVSTSFYDKLMCLWTWTEGDR